MELSYNDFLQNSFISLSDIERLFSLETYNNNNRVYELDKKIQPEGLYDEKGSEVVEESDDMEGLDDINVLDDIEGADLYDDDDDDDDGIEEDQIELKQGMTFDTWEIAETYLENFAKQKGFSFRKRRCVTDAIDNTIVRKRTFECSHSRLHKPDKAILEENRRDRNSEMIRCPWHINMTFPKTAKGVQISSIIGEHNHALNPLIIETAPKFQKLTNEMLEKIKFWTIHGRMGITNQYNLLVASFPDKVINRKDLSNAIQKFKKQMKPNRNDACQMLNELYLKKENNPMWVVKPRFDPEERRLNSLFWMAPDQIIAYERYHDVVIVDTTSRTNQFDMILMLFTVIDNNFRNLIVAAALLEDETEETFAWVLQELRSSCEVIPTVLYSDADPALISAVKNNYQDTRHFHCIFHIDLNLRKKLKGKLRDQFEDFRAKFLKMRNSLCHNQFEIQWNNLINEYPESQQYLTRVLYSCKTSWASYAINRNFTAGVQSSQRAEVSNKLIKEKLNWTSQLTDVVEEVQAIFDKQSKKAMLTECINEIPTRGLPSILNEYFPELDTKLQEYLTPQILQKQRDQMAQSLCYDVTLIDDWLSLLEVKNFNFNNSILENSKKMFILS
jgi:hypothetical protein